jgi:CDGSH-type Zn-finger protein
MSTPPPVTITAKPNGPLLVAGPIALVDATGAVVPTTPDRVVALCRCGHSSMKPFCDGSHSRTGFTASEPAPR